MADQGNWLSDAQYEKLLTRPIDELLNSGECVVSSSTNALGVKLGLGICLQESQRCNSLLFVREDASGVPECKEELVKAAEDFCFLKEDKRAIHPVQGNIFKQASVWRAKSGQELTVLEVKKLVPVNPICRAEFKIQHVGSRPNNRIYFQLTERIASLVQIHTVSVKNVDPQLDGTLWVSKVVPPSKIEVADVTPVDRDFRTVDGQAQPTCSVVYTHVRERTVYHIRLGKQPYPQPETASAVPPAVHNAPGVNDSARLTGVEGRSGDSTFPGEVETVSGGIGGTNLVQGNRGGPEFSPGLQERCREAGVCERGSSNEMQSTQPVGPDNQTAVDDYVQWLRTECAGGSGPQQAVPNLIQDVGIAKELLPGLVASLFNGDLASILRFMARNFPGSIDQMKQVIRQDESTLKPGPNQFQTAMQASSHATPTYGAGNQQPPNEGLTSTVQNQGATHFVQVPNSEWNRQTQMAPASDQQIQHTGYAVGPQGPESGYQGRSENVAGSREHTPPVPQQQCTGQPSQASPQQGACTVQSSGHQIQYDPSGPSFRTVVAGSGYPNQTECATESREQTVPAGQLPNPAHQQYSPHQTPQEGGSASQSYQHSTNQPVQQRPEGSAGGYQGGSEQVAGNVPNVAPPVQTSNPAQPQYAQGTSQGGFGQQQYDAQPVVTNAGQSYPYEPYMGQQKVENCAGGYQGGSDHVTGSMEHAPSRQTQRQQTWGSPEMGASSKLQQGPNSGMYNQQPQHDQPVTTQGRREEPGNTYERGSENVVGTGEYAPSSTAQQQYGYGSPAPQVGPQQAATSYHQSPSAGSYYGSGYQGRSDNAAGSREQTPTTDQPQQHYAQASTQTPPKSYEQGSQSGSYYASGYEGRSENMVGHPAPNHPQQHVQESPLAGAQQGSSNYQQSPSVGPYGNQNQHDSYGYMQRRVDDHSGGYHGRMENVPGSREHTPPTNAQTQNMASASEGGLPQQQYSPYQSPQEGSSSSQSYQHGTYQPAHQRPEVSAGGYQGGSEQVAGSVAHTPPNQAQQHYSPGPPQTPPQQGQGQYSYQQSPNAAPCNQSYQYDAYGVQSMRPEDASGGYQGRSENVAGSREHTPPVPQQQYTGQEGSPLAMQPSNWENRVVEIIVSNKSASRTAVILTETKDKARELEMLLENRGCSVQRRKGNKLSYHLFVNSSPMVDAFVLTPKSLLNLIYTCQDNTAGLFAQIHTVVLCCAQASSQLHLFQDVIDMHSNLEPSLRASIQVVRTGGMENQPQAVPPQHVAQTVVTVQSSMQSNSVGCVVPMAKPQQIEVPPCREDAEYALVMGKCILRAVLFFLEQMAELKMTGMPTLKDAVNQLSEGKESSQVYQWVIGCEGRLSTNDSRISLQDIQLFFEFIKLANQALQMVEDVGWRITTRQLYKFTAERKTEAGRIFRDAFNVFAREEALGFASAKEGGLLSMYAMEVPKFQKLVEILMHRRREGYRVIVLAMRKSIVTLLRQMLSEYRGIQECGMEVLHLVGLSKGKMSSERKKYKMTADDMSRVVEMFNAQGGCKVMVMVNGVSQNLRKCDTLIRYSWHIQQQKPTILCDEILDLV